MTYRVGTMVDGVPGSDLHEFELGEGESYRNVPGTIHQMIAITDCDLLEASTPDLDDVVRLKDRYGREGTSAP
jgi:mannose-6-phosphate isomerase